MTFEHLFLLTNFSYINTYSTLWPIKVYFWNWHTSRKKIHNRNKIYIIPHCVSIHLIDMIIPTCLGGRICLAGKNLFPSTFRKYFIPVHLLHPFIDCGWIILNPTKYSSIDCILPSLNVYLMYIFILLPFYCSW